MFCPRCAAQNTDDTKFCRACGTNLATVNLVLSDPQQLSTAALERVGSISSGKRREGISRLVHGTGWIGASAIVGIALGLFSNTNDWIFVWLGLASWMACWGIIQWSQGINKLIEARYLSRELVLATADSSQTIPQLPVVANTNELAPPGSVSEGTTELLKRGATPRMPSSLHQLHDRHWKKHPPPCARVSQEKTELCTLFLVIGSWYFVLVLCLNSASQVSSANKVQRTKSKARVSSWRAPRLVATWR